MEWLARNSDAISALTSAGTLLVWLVYLQVFISNYRRGLRATFVIARGAGEGLSARCLVSNMSSGAIYISSVQLIMRTGTGDIVGAVTDINHDGPDWTRQGPLGEGECQDIGSFDDLIRQAFAAAARDRLPASRVTVEVVGIYGSEDLPVGARRTFVVHDTAEGRTVRGIEGWTEQIRSRGARRALKSVVSRDL